MEPHYDMVKKYDQIYSLFYLLFEHIVPHFNLSSFNILILQNSCSGLCSENILQFVTLISFSQTFN